MDLGPAEPVKKRVKRSLVAAIVLFVALNILAYHHARSFFHYTESGERTLSPEQMSWGDKFRTLITGINVPKPVSHTTPAAWSLEYESISLPGREGLLLSGWRIPSTNCKGVAVVFHGYSSEKSGLLPEAALLHDLGLDVVMVDFPGHGASPGNRTTLGIDESLDVVSVYQWVREKYPDQPAVLYGHSMGGVAVLRAVARTDIRPDAVIAESIFDSLLQAIRHRFRLLNAPSFPSAEILLFWGSVQLGVNGFSHDVVAYARDIRVPVLISHGSEDNRAGWRDAEKVYDSLAGPKQWLLMEGAGHVNPCLVDTGRWKQTVEAFLNLR